MNMKTTEKAVLCHVCNHTAVKLSEKMQSLPRAASDCRPWKSGGTLGTCTNCGVVQKGIDKEWREEAQEIYTHYDLYHQSINGIEQAAFNTVSGEGKPRSKKILEYINNNLDLLPSKGRMIDVGCGTGGFLSAFSSIFEDWELNGFEPNVKTRSRLMEIHNVRDIYSARVEDLPGIFDLISVIHALEHIENPISFLQSLKNKIHKNGLLLIQVPYFLDNPFDLIIADHCTHFTLSSLSSVMQAAGFEIVYISSKVIDKEITLLAKPSLQVLPMKKISNDLAFDIIQAAECCLKWLKTVISEADNIAKSSSSFGLFGTSISANWLLGSFEDSIEFFVDEDETRVGRSYRNRPVYRPQDIPIGSNVFMPLPRNLADLIAKRNHYDGVYFNLPPHFNWTFEKVA